jgi:hypothetical protein
MPSYLPHAGHIGLPVRVQFTRLPHAGQYPAALHALRQ